MLGALLMGGGSGNAWLNDHDKILEHARNLHYDHVPGVDLPSAVDPDDYTEEDKQEWISAMDAFNAWKAREIPKEKSGQAWWQTYTESQDASSGSGKSGGKSGNLLDNNPKENVYFPMLVPEYAPPIAQDWSAYMPRVGPYDAPIPNLGVEGGLFYQPWVDEYQQEFVPSNIWNYTPPQLNVGSPTFSGTPATGLLEIVHPEPETTPTNPNSYLENRGGRAVNSGPLAGLGYWSGNEFNDVYGNTWDGTDFSTEAELASMVSFGHPNAEVAFANWSGWNPATPTIGDLFGNLFGGDEPDPTGPEAAVSDANNPSTTGVTYD